MSLTFNGGVFLDLEKNSADVPFEFFGYSDKYEIPLCQHAGSSCVSLVTEGQRVLMGQVIASDDRSGAVIHSPVSGHVERIVSAEDDTVGQGGYITVINDYLEEKDPSFIPFGQKSSKTLADLTVSDLIEVVRAAGICGMSGAGIPTFQKLTAADGRIRRVMVNAIECEPYLCVNQRLAIEAPDRIIGGLKIILAAFRIKNGVIAMPDHADKAIRSLQKANVDKAISVKVFSSKYPQGDERQLFYSLTGREIPFGKTSIDMGTLILNAETVGAVYDAFALGSPLICRRLTVDGDLIEHPKNFIVPIGTPTSSILEKCSFKKRVDNMLILHSGAMMGKAISSADAPIEKRTCAILVFDGGAPKIRSGNDDALSCTRCARCVEACPMRIFPLEFANTPKKRISVSLRRSAESCVLCGACQYVCPAGIDLIERIKAVKLSVAAPVSGSHGDTSGTDDGITSHIGSND